MKRMESANLYVRLCSTEFFHVKNVGPLKRTSAWNAPIRMLNLMEMVFAVVDPISITKKMVLETFVRQIVVNFLVLVFQSVILAKAETIVNTAKVALIQTLGQLHQEKAVNALKDSTI